ncbi:MAG: HAMP domain-containing histidine kinase [Actinomycetales bacterium]|nr:HAMP domain-containing histidine kinase [Actinomycetales bacterium]
MARGLERLRRSLSLRVAVITSVSMVAAVGVMGGYVSAEIRDGLFENRVEQMLGDAAWRLQQTQGRLDTANASTLAQVQSTAADVVRSLQNPSSGMVGAMMLRSPGESSPVTILEPITSAALRELPSEDLRQSVAIGRELSWQSVAVPTGSGTEPGIVVGGEVSVPLAGVHELYMVYTLAPEQQTIDLIMRVLGIGAVVLAVLIGLSVWTIMWRALRPVRQLALAAERLAAGVLDERMAVRGRDELATMARSFNEMADSLRSQITRLEELSRLQQRFVSDVSHELRTPLTTIRMAAEMLYEARGDFDPVVRRSAELLQAQIDRFESMLADLLEISRFDAGAATLAPEEQDLRPLIRRVVEFSSPLAERNGTVVRLSGFELPATAAVDDRRVERILRNLVVNAIEHSGGRPVDVELAQNETAVAVRVVDTGTGMSPYVAAHVFDRFWRADPARARTTGGTGLGLAISLEDARLHGGTLEAWGEEGAVASFLLCLPRRVGADFVPPITVVPERLAPLATGGTP